MELTKQVVSLELAKKLKILGVKQDSILSWMFLPKDEEWSVQFHTNNTRFGELSRGEWVASVETGYSAFTVAELGEMLPFSVKGENKEKYLTYGIISVEKKTGSRQHYARLDEAGFDGLKTADTEADARAKMLIYLLENKLI